MTNTIITTNTNKEMTIAQKFEMLKSIPAVQEIAEFDAVSFLDSRIEQAKRKSTSNSNEVRKARKAKADAPLIANIKEVLVKEGRPIKAGDIAYTLSMETGKAVSIPKVTAMLQKMSEVVNIKEGKNSFYALS